MPKKKAAPSATKRPAFRASTKTVAVHCGEQGCATKGIAAENAVKDSTPWPFRATCPIHEVPLKVGKRK